MKTSFLQAFVNFSVFKVGEFTVVKSGVCTDLIAIKV